MILRRAPAPPGDVGHWLLLVLSILLFASAALEGAIGAALIFIAIRANRPSS
jgi:hypothetical protein